MKSMPVYIENNTWAYGDMEFVFECSTRYRVNKQRIILFIV